MAVISGTTNVNPIPVDSIARDAEEARFHSDGTGGSAAASSLRVAVAECFAEEGCFDKAVEVLSEIPMEPTEVRIENGLPNFKVLIRKEKFSKAYILTIKGLIQKREFTKAYTLTTTEGFTTLKDPYKELPRHMYDLCKGLLKAGYLREAEEVFPQVLDDFQQSVLPDMVKGLVKQGDLNRAFVFAKKINSVQHEYALEKIARKHIQRGEYNMALEAAREIRDPERRDLMILTIETTSLGDTVIREITTTVRQNCCRVM